MQNFNQKAEEYLEMKLTELEKTFEMEKELMKYGRKVHGGYMMTFGDLLEFFKKNRRV